MKYFTATLVLFILAFVPSFSSLAVEKPQHIIVIITDVQGGWD